MHRDDANVFHDLTIKMWYAKLMYTLYCLVCTLQYFHTDVSVCWQFTKLT